MHPKDPQFLEASATDATAYGNGTKIGYHQNTPVSELIEKAAKGEFTPVSGAGIAEGKRDRDIVKNSSSQAIKNKEKMNKGRGVIKGGRLIKGGSLELRQDLDSNSKGKN